MIMFVGEIDRVTCGNVLRSTGNRAEFDLALCAGINIL